MDRVRNDAADIAETIPGCAYLRGEYGTSFVSGQFDGEWIAERCPLCSGEKTFTISESPKHLADWKCSSCPSASISSGPFRNLAPNHGDLVTLVALKEKVSQGAAVRLIRDHAKPYLKDKTDPDNERMDALRRACNYFRLMLEQQPRVVTYLNGRSIDWSALQKDFKIGGNDVTVDSLAGYLEQFSGYLDRLNQGHNSLIRKRSFTLQPAVVAPLYEEDQSFVGLQLRRCGEELKPGYVTKGLNSAAKKKFLYGLHLPATRTTAAASGTVIVCKGVFDCWACHQNGHKNAVATLAEGITKLQFDRVAVLGTKEIVLGLTSYKEVGIARALASGALQLAVSPIADGGDLASKDSRRTVSRIKPGRDLADDAGNADAIADMIGHRVAVMEAGQRATGLALVRESHKRLGEELDAGRYFVVASGDKGRDQSSLLTNARRLNRKTHDKPGYIKIPHRFVDAGLHTEVRSALCLLLYLHGKKTGIDRPVSIKRETIANDLGLSTSTINKQAQKLRDLGLLVAVPPDSASPKNAWDWYPLFVPMKE
jgi:hypothetical protein